MNLLGSQATLPISPLFSSASVRLVCTVPPDICVTYAPSPLPTLRRLCDRPLSPAAASLLLSLLPVCPLSAELASSLSLSLCAAAGEPHHRSSASFARLLLVTVQSAGRMMDAEDRARLAAAAEQSQTALRRAVQAALRRLQ